jgi:hypothetical protein
VRVIALVGVAGQTQSDGMSGSRVESGRGASLRLAPLVSLVPKWGKQQSNPIGGAGEREVDVMSRQRRKQRRNPARRPWWRPLVGLGLLAGWLAASPSAAAKP